MYPALKRWAIFNETSLQLCLAENAIDRGACVL